MRVSYSLESALTYYERYRPRYWKLRYLDGSGATLTVVGEQIIEQNINGVVFIPNGLGQSRQSIPWSRVVSLKQV